MILYSCQNRASSDQTHRAPREISIDSPRSSIREAHEHIAMGLAAEAERERLLELVAVLNQRLDKERSDYEQLSVSLKLGVSGRKQHIYNVY